MIRVLLGSLMSAAAWGGCLSMPPAAEGSKCSATSAELRWVNAPATPEAAQRLSRQPYDELLADPAFLNGVRLKGEQRFAFSAKGRHLVEVLVANPEADRFPFRLSADGSLVDERPLIAPGPGRMRPKRNLRHTSLLVMVDGTHELQLTSDAPWYNLYAVRWTPAAEVEKALIPRWRERVRYLHSTYLPEAQGATARRAWMQQLSDRLAFSSNAAIRREALLGRARAWYWLAAENHEPDDLLQMDQLLREGLKIMPASTALRQLISAMCSGQAPGLNRMARPAYCDAVQPVPWDISVPAPPPGAPEWAVAQRRLVRRMDAITRWWVEKRQSPNGELGGGWGDDVEILRHWGPQALGFGSEVAARGILNVAGGLWNSGTLLHGYDRGISDVEHSAEPTTDTQPLATALHPGDAELRQRLGQTAACSEHWIKQQPDGQYRFRSSWFNCRDADTSSARAVDVHLNNRAMGPALWSAYLSRDPALVKRIAAWADAWIVVMRDTRHGKPAGVFPSVMRASDGEYLIGANGWDKPEAEWDYFQWGGTSQEALTSLLLAVYDLTGERKYLDAAGETFRVMENCAAHEAICRAIRSSPEAFYTWRRLTGDARYDQAFGNHASPPDADIFGAMARTAREAEARFSVNWDIFTTEVLYTDRVAYPLASEYRWRLFGGEAPRGDRYPTFAVTWPAVKGDIARAVLDAGDTALRVQLYNFEASHLDAQLRLWRLKPGRYQWTDGERRGEFTVARLPHLLSVPLPPGKEVALSIQRAE